MVVQHPVVDRPSIVPVEIGTTGDKATADHVLGNIVASLVDAPGDAPGDARDRSLGIRQREEKQRDVPALGAPVGDAPQIAAAGRVVSNAKLAPRAMQASIFSSISRPART